MQSANEFSLISAREWTSTWQLNFGFTCQLLISFHLSCVSLTVFVFWFMYMPVCVCVCSCFVLISNDTVSRKIKTKPNLNGRHWCKAKGFSLRRIYLTTILIKTSNNLKSVFGVCVLFALFFFCSYFVLIAFYLTNKAQWMV